MIKAGKTVVAKDSCAWSTAKPDDAPRQAELLANGAEGIKTRTATAANVCVERFAGAIGKL